MTKERNHLDLKLKKLSDQNKVLKSNLRKSERLFRDSLSVKMRYEDMIAALYKEPTTRESIKKYLEKQDLKPPKSQVKER